MSGLLKAMWLRGARDGETGWRPSGRGHFARVMFGRGGCPWCCDASCQSCSPLLDAYDQGHEVGRIIATARVTGIMPEPGHEPGGGS